MLKIRLQRTGRKHQPTYRLVLTDSKNSTKSGKYLEILGNYDSRNAEKAEFKNEKITEWISKGAQLSDTVHNLLVERKVIVGKKVNKLPLKKATVKETPAEVAPASVSASESVKEEVAVEETVTSPESKEETSAPEVAPEVVAEEASETETPVAPVV